MAKKKVVAFSSFAPRIEYNAHTIIYVYIYILIELDHIIGTKKKDIRDE